jgi:hypothetical protein
VESTVGFGVGVGVVGVAGGAVLGGGDEVPRHGENRPRRRSQGGVRVAR